MNDYRITLKHDTGTSKLTVAALSIEMAIQMICIIEGCPSRAIVKVEVLPEKRKCK